MAIPVYLWLYDENGTLIRGGSTVQQREGTIEVLELMHTVERPTDPHSGKIIGTRAHSGYAFEKETDETSPYLYRALTTGKTLSKAVFTFYRINDAGQEEAYYITTLEEVIVSEIIPFFSDSHSAAGLRRNHHEYVDLRFKKITWHYLDGNIMFSDSWNERKSA